MSLVREKINLYLEKAIPSVNFTRKENPELITKKTTYIKDVYLKFHANFKARWGKTAEIKFYNKEGDKVAFEVAQKNLSKVSRSKIKYFTIYSNEFKDLMRLIGKKSLPYFDRLIIFLREEGIKAINDEKYIYLRLLVATPGAKKLTGRTNNKFVPACKSCDGVLVTNIYHPINPRFFEGDLKNCPHCGAPMDYYWREGKVHEFDFIFESEVWERFKDKKMYYSVIPCKYKGKIHPLFVENEDAAKFMVWYTQSCPNGVLGPFCIVIDNFGRDLKTIFPYEENPPEFNPHYLYPKQMITPKKIFYDESLTMEQRFDMAESLFLSAREKNERKRRNKLKKEKELEKIRNTLVNLNDILESGEILDARKKLSGVYLKMYRTTRGVNSAQYYAKICTSDGIEADFDVYFEKKNITPFFDEVQFTKGGLTDLLTIIQTNEPKLFSEVKFYVEESSVTYRGTDTHYYLKPILNSPRISTKVSLGGKVVKACASCNNMLLRYSFDWKVQKDDLKEKVCPYCGDNLTIFERTRRIVPVFLDFNAENLRIEGHNNQIGVLYSSVPVKLTTKVKSTFQFLQNYEALFDHGVIGPLNMHLVYHHSRVKIKDIEFGGTLKGIQWRPAVLYPEDLINF